LYLLFRKNFMLRNWMFTREGRRILPRACRQFMRSKQYFFYLRNFFFKQHIFSISERLKPGYGFSPKNWTRNTFSVWASLEPVLQIHDILVWIRIRIRGSMPLTNGSGSGSVCGSGSSYFHHWPSRCQQKTNFFVTKGFLLITFWRYICFTDHFSKIKSQKVVTKQ